MIWPVNFRNLVVTGFVILLTIQGFTQQFSYTLQFKDAAGIKDSLVLGYGTGATDTIDPGFGEGNIIQQAYSNTMDVRFSNVYMKQIGWYGTAQENPFNTKTQFVPDFCGTDSASYYFPVIEIDIVHAQYPVTARWIKSLFNNSCRNGSVFTSVHPGGWWDTGGFRAILKDQDSVVFNHNVYHYMNGSDTVYVFWAAFGDSTILQQEGLVKPISCPYFSVYPVPAGNTISFNLPPEFSSPVKVEIYNITGQKVLETREYRNVNISGLTGGIYLLRITNQQGKQGLARFIRE
ncbi:MAG: T9SS type A sorting domain-containing protein [Bacteroidia bacterium]|nr:T9SS type A sorting domain-containing protein [Bacteroidia bacterium]